MTYRSFRYLGVTHFGDNISEGTVIHKEGKRIGELLKILFNVKFGGGYLFFAGILRNGNFLIGGDGLRMVGGGAWKNRNDSALHRKVKGENELTLDFHLQSQPFAR